MPADKQSSHLDHLTIPVRDVTRSRNWYTTTLGLSVEFDVPSLPAAALQDSSGFGLFLKERANGDFHACCVLTFRVDDVDELARALRADGITLSEGPQKFFWGYGAELRDPDGYLVRLWDEKSMKEKGG